MTAIDQTMVSNILNATLPVTASAKPSIAYWTAGGLSQSAGMHIRLDSTAPTASAMGTELSGTNYVAKGAPLTTAVTASSAGSSVSLPASADVAACTWTNSSGGAWNIVGLDITDGATTPIRAWWGLFNGQPIAVAIGNSFQIALNAIQVSLA